MESERILVTGGAGFIGSHLVEAFLRLGCKVTVLDDCSSGKRENLEGLAGDLRFVEGSILSADDLRRALEGVGQVSHQAAFGSVPRSLESPELYSQNNLHGTVCLLHEARKAGVRRITLASSSSVYGDDRSPVKREATLGSPLSPYAASKRATELFAQTFASNHAMTIVCMRYFNVFGPRQDPAGPYAAVVPRFAETLLHGGIPRINGDGHQSRDFTYVGNVVEANRSAIQSDIPQGCHILNVGCGGSTSVLELLRILADIVGVEARPEHGPPRTGDVRDSMADISLAGDVIGYSPKVGLREGLRRTMEWFAAREKSA